MSAQFQPLNLFSELDIYHLQLPHWRQEDVTYFVTWRLADSLPQNKLRQLGAEREQWLIAHGLERPAQIESLEEEQRHEYHRLFTNRVHQWLDAGMGSCALRNPKVAGLVKDALRHFDGERYVLDAFVVMPNHVHALVAPTKEWRLDQILHSWKSFTANVINRELDRKRALWLDETWDHIVRSAAQLEHFRTYIRENPGKAALPEGEFVVGCGTGLETK
jgi:REP element-mobilizing transposase RayT